MTRLTERIPRTFQIQIRGFGNDQVLQTRQDCNETHNSILFYIMFVGLSLFCMSLIIHNSLSGTLGWNEINIYHQNYVEAFVTKIVAIIGLGLFIICGFVFALVNRHVSNEAKPQ